MDVLQLFLFHLVILALRPISDKFASDRGLKEIEVFLV